MKKFSILVVGDDPDSHQVIESLQNQNGAYRSIEFTDSLENALSALLHDSFDAILVNPELGDAPGLESVRKLITAAPDAAIIVISGHRDDELLAVKCVRFGAQDYIEKHRLSPLLLKKSIIYAVERKKRLLEREDIFSDLAGALEMIEKLQVLLPVCVSCKKFFDESDQSWLDIDRYIQKTARMHAPKVCPDCRESLNRR